MRLLLWLTLLFCAPTPCSYCEWHPATEPGGLCFCCDMHLGVTRG